MLFLILSYRHLAGFGFLDDSRSFVAVFGTDDHNTSAFGQSCVGLILLGVSIIAGVSVLNLSARYGLTDFLLQ